MQQPPWIPPDLSDTGARVRLGVLLYQCATGLFEWFGSTFPYSKFRHARSGIYGYGGFSAAVPSRIGMVMAYGAPLATFISTADVPKTDGTGGAPSASLLLYGLPLVAILAGAVTGSALAGTDAGTMIGALGGVAVVISGFGLVRGRLERATLAGIEVVQKA